MKYKRHKGVYTDNGIVSFSPVERSKLYFTYVCPSCKSMRHFSFIENGFIYDLDFFVYLGCCGSFSNMEFKKFIKVKLRQINKEAPTLINKIKQCYKGFPLLHEEDNGF